MKMGEAAPKESSMEDILASIRKIISSEDKRAGTEEFDPPEAKPRESSPKESSTSPRSFASVASQKPQTGVRPSQPAATEPQKENSLANLAARLSPKNAVGKDTIAAKPSSEVTPERASVVATKPAEETAAPSGSLAALAEQVKTGKAAAMTTAQPVAAPKTEDAPLAETAKVDEPERATEPVDEKPMGAEKSLAAIQKEVSVARPQDHDVKTWGGDKAEVPALASATKTSQEDETAKAFKEALVSPSTQEAVSNSMDRLKKSVADIDNAQVEAVLRPLLKEWLDENLSDMVEKVVREEISRIANSNNSQN